MSIFKSFLHNLLFILSNVLFPILSFAYASQILGPEGLGKVQFVLTFAQYFVLVAALGIPVYGIREVAKVRNDRNGLSRLFSELLAINLISSLVLLLAYLIVIFTMGWFQADHTYYLLGGLIILMGFSTIDWFFMGMEQFQLLSIRSMVIKGVALVALVLLIHSPQDLLIYFLITLFSLTGNNLWNLINLKGRVSIRFKRLNLTQHLPALFTLFGTTVIVSIYTMMDTLFLGFMTDHRSVGFYTAAIKMSKIAIPLVASLGTVLIPGITRSIAGNDGSRLQRLSGQSFAFICLMAVPISCGLYCYAPEIIRVFSGSQYLEAIPTMQIAAPLVILIGLGSVFGPQLLIPAGRERRFFWSTVLGMTASVALNLLLIPLLKDRGAAIAIVMAEVIVTLTAFLFVHYDMRLRFDWSLLLKALLACVPFLPICFVLRFGVADPVVRLTLAIIACGVSYFGIQYFIFRERLVRDASGFLFGKLTKQRVDAQNIGNDY